MDDSPKIMRWGLIIAAVIIVVRIVLEQAGAPEAVNNIFGVSWLHFLFPVLFALSLRAAGHAKPYQSLFGNLLRFTVYVRLMVMATYMLAFLLQWGAPRFSTARGGNVGGNVSALRGFLFIPVRNASFWIVSAMIIGMALGALTLLLKRRPPAHVDAG